MHLQAKHKKKKRRLLIMEKEIWDVEGPLKGLYCNKGKQWLLGLHCLVAITFPLQKISSISFRAEHFAKCAI